MDETCFFVAEFLLARIKDQKQNYKLESRYIDDGRKGRGSQILGVVNRLTRDGIIQAPRVSIKVSRYHDALLLKSVI